MLDEKTESRVLEFIANAKEPIHSTEIAKALGINRITATKYLSVLHSKGLIAYKNIGMAKVWLPVENPVLLAFEKNDADDTTIQALNSLADGVAVLDRDFNLVWINREMEKRHGRLAKLKGEKCFDAFHQEADVCKNCPAKKTFETGKKERATIKKKDCTIEISASPLKDQKGRVIAAIKTARIR